MPIQSGPAVTEMFDTFIDGKTRGPKRHETTEAARAYAADISQKTRSEVHVLNANDVPIGKYVNGIDEMAAA